MNTRVCLTGWLFESARYTLRGIHRAHRRRFHEHAAARSDPRSAPHPASDDTLGALDAAALAVLSTSDRRLLLLRYHRNLAVKAIVIAAGATESATRKRLARAIGRLRKHLAPASTASLSVLAKAAESTPPLLPGCIPPPRPPSPSSMATPSRPHSPSSSMRPGNR